MASLSTRRNAAQQIVLPTTGDGGEALSKNGAWIDAFQGGVKDRTDTPPGSPSEGDLYILTGTPTGAWSAQAANDVALYYNSGWLFFTPPTGEAGIRLYVIDEDTDYRWDGSAWGIVVSGGGGGGGDLIDDTTPQLGGNLDVNGFNVGGVTPTELGHVSGVTSDIQTQIDGKAATSHTHTASDITDFDTEVSNNTTVASALQDVVDDTTPQLGGNLDVNGNTIVSTSNGNIGLIPDGTGNVVLGTLTFDGDMAVTSNEDDYVLTYDHSNGTVSLEVIPATSKIDVKNDTAGTLLKGRAVHVTGSHSSGKPTIEYADSSSASTMNAIGILEDDIAAGGEGYVTLAGIIENIDTSSYTSGDTLYVGTSGVLTDTKPTGTDLIQNMGMVGRSHASVGSFIVIGSGRSNDVPNLPQDFLWLGNASGVATPTNKNEITELSDDTTPQLGGNLDVNGFNVGGVTPTEFTHLSGVTSAIQTQLDGKSATGHTHTASDITDFDTEVSNNTTVASALQDVVDDTTPQLGGNLDAQSNDITNVDNLGIGTPSPLAPLHIDTTGIDDSLLITNDDATADAAPVITLKRDSASPADGDYLGQIKFKGENDASQEIVYAKITGKISDVTDTTEDGLIETAVKADGSNLIVSRQTHNCLKLINGNGLEVDGDVGIGTTSADATLHAALSGTGDIFKLERTDANGHLIIDFVTQWTNLDSDGKYNFYVDTAKAFEIDGTSGDVNYVGIDSAATGSGPKITAAGDDTNINLNLSAKGTGSVYIDGTDLLLDNGETVVWGAGSGIIEAGATADVMTFTVGGFTQVCEMTASALEMSQDIVLYTSAGGPSANTEGSLWYDTSLGDGRAVVHQAGNNAKAIARMTPIQIRPQQLIADSTSGFGITTRNQHVLAAFDDTTDETGYFTGVLPDDYNGDGLTVEIIWVAETAASGTVQWDVAFEALNAQDIDSDGFTTEQTASGTANGTSGVKTSTTISFTNAQIDGLLAGEAFRLSIMRDVSEDTMADDAQIVGIKIYGTNDFY